MDFKLKFYKGHSWNTKALSNVLEQMGCKTLSEAITKERENVKANGYKPIEIEHKPSSNESRPIPNTVRLPYSDPD